MHWTKEKYLITTDAAAVDIDVVHRYLSIESYWAKGIPRETVKRAVQHYAQFGFTPMKAPDRWMERHDPDVYTR